LRGRVVDLRQRRLLADRLQAIEGRAAGSERGEGGGGEKAGQEYTDAPRAQRVATCLRAHCVSCEGERHSVPSPLAGEGQGEGWRRSTEDQAGSVNCKLLGQHV